MSLDPKSLLKHIRIEVKVDVQGLAGDLVQAGDEALKKVVADSENKFDDGLYAVVGPVVKDQITNYAGEAQAYLDKYLAELQAKLRGEDPA